MAFDAGMLASVIHEIKKCALGARIEKVYQPAADELIFGMRSFEGGTRLLINAGGNNPRIGFTESARENPQNPPMFCMLLRKHLSGAKLNDIYQSGFERVVTLEFLTRDEMGFECKRYIIAEIMGKYSNLIFADENMRIISPMKTVDFTTSSLRQVLPGMQYELPPTQNKRDPLLETREGFEELMSEYPLERPAEKFISSNYMGVSAAVAREIAYRACGDIEGTVGQCGGQGLADSFFEMIGAIKENRFDPSIVLKKDSLAPVEYAFCRLTHYASAGYEVRQIESESKLLDMFYENRDREARVKQFASDLLRLLCNVSARINKKLELQRGELADCEKGEEYKKIGDLITANIYLLKRGMKQVELTDYEEQLEDGSFRTRTVELDERLSPAANAQRMYKRYNKTKSARIALTEQIALGEAEARYIDTVFDSLTRAETPGDLSEIREELYRSGYASKMKKGGSSKPVKTSVMEYRTSGGYRVLCGKNNIQNEQITFKMAEKTDYWFHVKNLPGSHVLMICNGEEPEALDFTEAAEIAAFNSKAEGENIAVDYTLAKNVKKPAAGKPGLVIYHTNWTAYVTPNKDRVDARRVK